MNAPHLPQGAIFVLMRQCLRFADGMRFFAAVFAFFCVCVWRRAAVFAFFFVVFAFRGGRPFFAAFCGWQLACVRCGRFLRRCLRFLRFLWLAAGGRAMRVFLLFAFGGGRPF